MEFLRHVWQWVSALGVEVQTFVAGFPERIWNTVPGSDTAQKLVVLGSVLGGLTALPVFHWLWQKWRHTDSDSRLERIEEALKAGKKRHRFALLIGNSDYRTEIPLKKSINSVYSVAEALRNKGFFTEIVTNANRETIIKCIDSFRVTAAHGGIELVSFFLAMAFQLRVTITFFLM